ncbi:hypothetical protein WR25_06708 isoform A [Diploscapter pachys]|uniref:DH domain-containing protein n=2 Tax=Diploscapter pachys TaxID=2018661 RepID=A0A2A2K0X3_9BILA|nr:hypothetical protein WR25_06708 isoform A [Diploscapter pachys]
MASMSKRSFDGLPDHIRRIGETDVPLEFDTFDTSSPGRHLQFLTHEQWNRFDLFGLGEKQADTWHERHRDELSKLTSKYVKKQDSIYELVHIEKQHCANLIFLQYGYRDRLMRERILSMKEVDRLIPGVLDTLLAFHLRLLERLLDRLEEKQHVDTISDIIAEELSEAIDRKPCINAYTQFGLAKEQAETFFNQLILKNSKFYEFIQHCNEEPIYKKFEFKPLLAKIIGRPTKYSIILENILKNEKEFAPEKEQTERAIKATKGFAQLINHSLLMSQMLRRLDTILQNVDPSSKTIIYIQDAQKANHVIPHEFTVEDLNLGVNTGPDSRELRCIGDVYLKQPGDNKIPIIMILFDDILLCLYRRNNKYHFLQDQSVFPIYSLIVRYPERAHSIFLLVSGKPKLLEVEFKSKQDKGLWTEAIELAISNSRREVRLTASTKNEAEDRVAQEQKAAEDKWLADLERLFRERESQEAGLSNYLESRFLFFDSIRTHIATLPFTTRADISDRVKQVVRQKFRELRLARTTPLNKLVERISASRDADLWTFFNDKVDCAIDPSDSQDSDESGAGSGESGLRRPRRIQTFHGTTPEQSSRGSDRSLRRHTTVPRTHSGLPIPLKDDAGEGSSHGGERYHFPYANSEESRHATERLVREVVKLRLENNRLRDENALVKTRSALIERTRAPQNVAAPSDSMEQLRKKEQLLRDKDEQLKTEQRLLDEDRAQLRKEEERFRTQEQDLGDKWTAFLETQSKMACIVDGNHPTSPMPSSSPVAAITSTSGRGLINSSLRSTNSFRDLPRSPSNRAAK